MNVKLQGGFFLMVNNRLILNKSIEISQEHNINNKNEYGEE